MLPWRLWKPSQRQLCLSIAFLADRQQSALHCSPQHADCGIPCWDNLWDTLLHQAAKACQRFVESVRTVPSECLVTSAGQGGITVPGSIGATPIEAPIDIEEGLPVEVPLVYFFGHATPADHSELYKLLVDRLATLMDRRAKFNPEVRLPNPAVALPPTEQATLCTVAEIAVYHLTRVRYLSEAHSQQHLMILQTCLRHNAGSTRSCQKPYCTFSRAMHIKHFGCACSRIRWCSLQLAQALFEHCGFAVAYCYMSGGVSHNYVQVAAAGMMINTMGWVEGLGFELLLHTITAMKANIVLVVGQDRLLSQLQSKYKVCHLSPQQICPSQKPAKIVSWLCWLSPALC